MKACTICKSQKPDEQFNKNASRKDGLNTICRECSNARSRKYYSDNIDLHRKNVNERKNRIVGENKEKFLTILRSSKCADCGTLDHRVLEFDHVRGIKKENVSMLLLSGWGWNTILREIDKCEIVCANCHRIRTHTRAGTYRIASSLAH